MVLCELPIRGAFIIRPEPQTDSRGFFARYWCKREFTAHGLNGDIVQCSIAFNRKRGTVRGLHYQAPPHAEVKLVRCTAGGIYDVLVDLRPGSDTYGKWFATDLTSRNHLMLYIPEEVAHGYQTLMDDTEVSYQMSAFHEPSAACGIRYDDPSIGAPWPLPVTIVSARDKAWPPFNRQFSPRGDGRREGGQATSVPRAERESITRSKEW